MTPTNACIDAETLAAWVDGGLSRNDAAMAEAHVSSCPRCQAIAGLIVKTAPVTPAGPPWWRARAPWLIPITAGVAAAGLLMIAPADSPTPGALTPGPAVATPTAGPPAATAKVEPAPSVAAPEAPLVSAAPKAAAPAPPVAAPAERRKERQRDERKNAAADTAVPAAPAPPAAVSGRVAAEQTTRQGFAAAATKDAVSPDGALRWRITDRGALERSTDGGTTWQAVNVGTTATFTTVEAPEPRTALVTTTDGRVFRTTDGGATWKLVPP